MAKVKKNNRDLERIISSVNKEWRLVAKQAIERLYYLLEHGKSVNNALDVLKKEYPTLYRLPNLKNSLVEAAAYGYGIVPDVLSETAYNAIGLKLYEAWDASGMTLSEKLHGTETKMREAITNVIRSQMRKNATWQEMAKALYDGYLQGDTDTLTPQSISNYMLNVRRAVSGDYKALSTQRKALDNISRLAKNGAPNKQLRTAYNELLEAVQFGTSEQLNKAINVAINEKSRYIAERIARTELARAWADGFWAKAVTDVDVVAVRYKLASRHPVFDICDMFAKADMYNLGVGVYPKDKVPQIPVHPHCLCNYVEVYVGEITTKRKNKIKYEGNKWLKGLSERQREAVLGVEGAQAWANGADWRDYMRGWHGLSNPKSRLMGNVFEANVVDNIASGALNDKNDPDGSKRRKHANMYYETRRNNGMDAFVNKINTNTGYPKSRLKRIYNHVFIQEHDLADGHHRFYSSFEMAQSFQRLLEGKNIQEHDLIMLKHEHLELVIMKKLRYNYSKAHELTNEKYNYSLAEKNWSKNNE